LRTCFPCLPVGKFLGQLIATAILEFLTIDFGQERAEKGNWLAKILTKKEY
jgi:hypothetical protein